MRGGECWSAIKLPTTNPNNMMIIRSSCVWPFVFQKNGITYVLSEKNGKYLIKRKSFTKLYSIFQWGLFSFVNYCVVFVYSAFAFYSHFIVYRSSITALVFSNFSFISFQTILQRFVRFLFFILISGEVYSIQHYMIKSVSDLHEVGGFLRVLRVPPPIKLKYC